MQLMWTVMLALPAIVALLHVPLLAQRLWESALDRNARVA
jgi:hypothetical protein